jgi:hypothetical protein
MSETFDAFLARAWADHADRSEAVADRLRTQTPAPGKPEHLSALARLVVHLLGEHLGRFDDGRWRLAALAGHALANADVQSALRVSQATLTLAEGRVLPMDGLSASERLRAEAGAAAICLGRGQTDRALAFLAAAREGLAALPQSTPADHRPLAVACNNMAWELQERGAALSAVDTAAMLDIAAASRFHWERAGTWLEVERAEYCLAITHLSAGQPDTALRHAAQCLAGCIDHDAPPYEHFFGHEALARVQQARGDAAARDHHVQAAEAAYDRLGADDQSGCRAALDTLRSFSKAR